MDKIFHGFQRLFFRLHVVLIFLLLLWEVIGQYSPGFKDGGITPLKLSYILIEDIFNISSYEMPIKSLSAFLFLVIIIFISHIFWSYLLGSFISNSYRAEINSDTKEQGIFIKVVSDIVKLILLWVLIALSIGWVLTLQV